MYKEKQHHQKMIDIYEADLEDYFKFLLQRVNSFLNSRSDINEKEIDQHQRVVRRKKAS